MIKIIVNSIIPVKGYTAICIWPFVFVRRDRRMLFSERTERHESIHALQQIEFLVSSIAVILMLVALGASPLLIAASPLLYYIVYGLEWLIKWPLCRFDGSRAYYSISFEQEAYAFQDDKYYFNVRPMFSWRYFVFNLIPAKK